MKPTLKEFTTGAQYQHFEDILLDILLTSKKQPNDTPIRILLNIDTPDQQSPSKPSYISISYDNKKIFFSNCQKYEASKTIVNPLTNIKCPKIYASDLISSISDQQIPFELILNDNGQQSMIVSQKHPFYLNEENYLNIIKNEKIYSKELTVTQQIIAAFKQISIVSLEEKILSNSQNNPDKIQNLYCHITKHSFDDFRVTISLDGETKSLVDTNNKVSNRHTAPNWTKEWNEASLSGTVHARLFRLLHREDIGKLGIHIVEDNKMETLYSKAHPSYESLNNNAKTYRHGKW